MPVSLSPGRHLDLESVLFHQISPLGVLSDSLKNALLTVNRAPFLPPASRSLAYADAPIILKRRCELPFFALALLLQGLGIENAEPKRRRAAVISAGAGYSSTVLSYMCQSVEAFESDSILFARLLEVGRHNMTMQPVTQLTDAPVDIILMDGGATTHIPQMVIDKLAPGGRLAVIEPIANEKNAHHVDNPPPLHPDKLLLNYPLCWAHIYQKSVNPQDDSKIWQAPPKSLFQIHVPILPSPLAGDAHKMNAFTF